MPDNNYLTNKEAVMYTVPKNSKMQASHLLHF